MTVFLLYQSFCDGVLFSFSYLFVTVLANTQKRKHALKSKLT